MHFHLLFNVVIAVAFLFFTEHIARVATRLMPKQPDVDDPGKPRYLDPSALSTPALAIGNAAREAMRIGDVIEQMLTGMLTVLKTNDRALAERLRKMDDIVDDLYTAIKLYLTQISREALEEQEGRRWADIVSFTINMEQVGDIIERIVTDLEDKKIDKGRSFSDAGIAEICDLHGRVLANLRPRDERLPARRSQERAAAALRKGPPARPRARLRGIAHLAADQTTPCKASRPRRCTSDLIADLKRINSHICSIAYPILEEAGVLAKTRLKEPPEPAVEAESGQDSGGKTAGRNANPTRHRSLSGLSHVCVLPRRRSGTDTRRHAGGAGRGPPARELERVAEVRAGRRRAARHRDGRGGLGALGSCRRAVRSRCQPSPRGRTWRPRRQSTSATT